MSEELDARLARIEAALQEIRSLIGPFGVPMGEGVTLVQTLYGVKFLVPTADDVMTPNLIVYRQWEQDVSVLLLSLTDKDSVFVDVGANFGYFTCLIGSRIGAHGEGRVIAFEPNPDSLGLLHRNININWSMAPIQIVEKAASDHEGEVRFARPIARAANATMLADEEAVLVDAEAITVPMTTLDTVLAPGQRVDVIKIDVEGWEFNVLRGATRVLSENPHVKIVMEWSAKQMQDAKLSPKAFETYIRKLGFAVQDVANGQVLPRGQIPHYANLLLSRPAPAPRARSARQRASKT